MQYAPVTLSDQPVNGLTCGIDWARDDHAVAIVDSGGRAVYRGVIEHSARGLSDLIVVLDRAGATEVAIERPDGPVVDALLRSRSDRGGHQSQSGQESAQPVWLGR